MKIKTYGTRGSVPIANPGSVNYGGNTTCIRIMSDCLPEGLVLAVDAGSGFVPMSMDVLGEMKGGLKEVMVLFSHYHHDHTQGLFLSPLTFIPTIHKRLVGPVDQEIGPRQMVEDMMRPPYFPVHSKMVTSKFSFKDLQFPTTQVIVFHRIGGHKIMNVDEYQSMIAAKKPLPIGDGKYPVDECLVVTMHKSRHPEQTISYRFEEKPTKRTFVFLTDHENEDGFPLSLQAHLKEVHLLLMDCQYSRAIYDARTAGFGHGTPDYCVKVALKVKAEKLGLTHHDPNSKDADIEVILDEAVSNLLELDSKAQDENKHKLEIVACADYMEIEV